ncbi:MAG: hypothetical protein H6625_09950 [Bdellovibrionaceae bacterium]|nr:hypothetical protein [Pseudobdellovibrionaceae bacterium]
MRNLKIGILFLLTLISWNSFASTLPESCEWSLSNTPFGDLANGLTYRGYLGQNPPRTPDAELEAIKYLIMHWGLKIYAVKSEQEAAELHDLQLHRNLTKEQRAELGDSHYISPPEASVFIVTQDDPKSYLDFYNYKVSDRNKVNEFFHQLAAKSQVFYYSLDGNKVVLKSDEVKKLENVFYMMNNPDDHFFYVPGWFAPKFKGVESISRFMLSSQGDGKASNHYKDLNKLLRKFYKEGVRITFNRAMDDVLILAGTQARIGRTNKVSKKSDVEKESPRFNKANRQTYLDLMATNNAYSVEVWDGDPNDPKTKLIGGTFGKMVGSTLKVDSLAYISMKKVRNYNQDKKPLFIVGEGLLLTEDMAKIKSEELLQRAREQGLSEEKIAQNMSYYLPKPSYVWEDSRKDQTGPDGKLEYLTDKEGDILEVPRGEFADVANLALYHVLKAQGIDLTDVGMVTPKSYTLFKARYVPLAEAIQLFNEQQQAFGHREILFPQPNEIFRPDGFSDKEYATIMSRAK